MVFHGNPWHSVAFHGTPWNSMAVESTESSVEFAMEIAVEFSVEFSMELHGAPWSPWKFPRFPRAKIYPKRVLNTWVTNKNICRRKKEARTEARTHVPLTHHAPDRKTTPHAEKKTAWKGIRSPSLLRPDRTHKPVSQR